MDTHNTKNVLLLSNNIQLEMPIKMLTVRILAVMSKYIGKGGWGFVVAWKSEQ